MTFGEDLSHIRIDESAENMAVLRTLALNLTETGQNQEQFEVDTLSRRNG